jgi:F0F1-type ATP synthase membrane subunit a
MFLVMIPVELLGMVVKPVALAIRLMANMTAGHILVAVIVSFTGMACSEPRLIELAYAFEQATKRRVPPPLAP